MSVPSDDRPTPAVGRRASAVILAGLVVGLISGAALGVLWWALAPRVTLVIRPGDALPPGLADEGSFGADVAFGVLALIAGVLVAIGLAYMRREHLFSVLVAALLAGGVGTAAMWFVGTRLGSVDVEGLIATTTADITVDAPLEVTLGGMFCLWPLASAVVVTILALADWVSETRARSGRTARR